jgi:HD-GYP domain-containing protein (c-di-GMP phosphodiesterase class II)
MLHDIGKVFIPKEILNKPGRLSDEEFEAIKSHSVKGHEYLKKFFDMPASSSSGVLQHHERFNGSGYPAGIKGNKITPFGKIIAIADVYDALTSKRAYRDAIDPSEAIEYIMGGCGSLFDPALVDIFLKKIAPYPIGTCVSLSNGMTGLVSENYSDCCLRPKVKIIKHGNIEVEPYFIDLKSDMSTLNITVTGIADGMSSPTQYQDEISETA